MANYLVRLTVSGSFAPGVDAMDTLKPPLAGRPAISERLSPQDKQAPVRLLDVLTIDCAESHPHTGIPTGSRFEAFGFRANGRLSFRPGQVPQMHQSHTLPDAAVNAPHCVRRGGHGD